MEIKSIIETKYLKTSRLCAECGESIPLLTLGEKITNDSDAVAGKIHRIPKYDELAPDFGILALSYMFRCPHCGVLHLLDERYTLAGYADRVNDGVEQGECYGDAEYYLYADYIIKDVYNVTFGDKTIEIPVDDIADPKVDIDSFIKQIIREHIRTHPEYRGKNIIIEHGEDDVILAKPKGCGYEIFVQRTRVEFD